MNKFRPAFQFRPLNEAFLLFACVFFLASCTKESSPSSSAVRREEKLPKLSAKDHEFVNHAARANLAEIQIAQLAAERAGSQPIRDFSQRLVKDHGEAHEQLEQIAAKRGVVLPDGLTDEQRAVVGHLRPLKGRKFDQAFQKHVVEDHQKNIETFSQAAEKSDDPELKSYAEKVLPALLQHIEAAKALESSQQSSNP
jgi:putative membrane protein